MKASQVSSQESVDNGRRSSAGWRSWKPAGDGIEPSTILGKQQLRIMDLIEPNVEEGVCGGRSHKGATPP
jgi:hypothetical protein